MKSLQISPQDHDISLNCCSIDDGIALVHLKLGDEINASHCFTSTEARRIGEWFIRLAKEMEAKK